MSGPNYYIGVPHNKSGTSYYNMGISSDKLVIPNDNMSILNQEIDTTCQSHHCLCYILLILLSDSIHSHPYSTQSAFISLLSTLPNTKLVNLFTVYAASF